LYIEKGQDIRVNDVFITSGIGEKYPVGIPVGKVVEVNNLPNEPFQIIRLKPIQNINSLDYILIGGQTNAN
jgi:rod shape-determining protein MreC